MHDVYDEWERYDDEKERRLLDRPICDYCDEHIQDEVYYEINGDIICPECLDTYFKRYI